jgi:murein DD-endopeptidase MepM/ murein hydrolase activator NlpD
MIAAVALVASLCWPTPVSAPITVPYRAPACRWCAGHEAVGWTVPVGTAVSAVAPGRVVFAGRVAEVGYVTVDVGDLRTTYGGLGQLRVQAGEVVPFGRVLGVAAQAVTFSVRVGGVHVDPTPFFARRVGRPRLVPVDGHRPRRWSARPWSTGESTCPARSAAR